METITFETLPKAVTTLIQGVEELKDLIRSQADRQKSETFLKIHQAAEFLGLTIPTLYSKVSRKLIPYMKQNGRLYFSTDELKAYLKAGRRATAQEMKDNANEYLK